MCWECAERADVPLDRCVHGDCADVLRDMPDRCVDLVLTDPPWGTSRLDFDGRGRPSVGVWREVKRVLKPDGWLACFGTMPMFADILGAGFVDAWTYVWLKSSAQLNLQPHLRPASMNEHIHVSHKGGKASDRYFNTEALKTYGHGNYWRRGKSRKRTTWNEGYRNVTWDAETSSLDGSRMPTTVLEFQVKNRMPKRERTSHPTQKPRPLLEYLIGGLCPPDGVVLDPYAGSGSTLIAARNRGRHWIGVEVDDKWHRLIEERMRTPFDYGDENEKEGVAPRQDSSDASSSCASDMQACASK